MRQLFIASVILCFGTITSVQADVIYSSFAEVCCSGFTVSGVNSAAGGAFSAAMGFTPSANFDLTQIDISLTWTAGTNSGPVLTLNSDNGGLPGSILMSWTLSGGLPPFVSNGACCTAIESVTPTSPLVLSFGSQYWLVATAGAADTWDDWVVGGNFGAPVAINQVAGGPLVRIVDEQGGFDVLGTPRSSTVPEPLPEPGTATAIELGLCFCFVARFSFGWARQPSSRAKGRQSLS
jgi:hypothetical protein